MPSKKQVLIYKIIMFVCVMIAFGLGIYFAVVLFAGIPVDYFTQHFALPICLACVAVVAFLLPLATKTKYGDDTKDNLMLVVAAILFLMSIAVCIFSYLNINF